MLKKILIGISITATLSFGAIYQLALPAQAAPKDIICDQIGQSSVDPTTGTSNLNCDPGQSQDIFDTGVGKVVNFLIFIVGAVAVGIIVVAGLMYVLSGGNPENTRRAKDAIIYAVVGLVIAIIARLIVTFVLTRF